MKTEYFLLSLLLWDLSLCEKTWYAQTHEKHWDLFSMLVFWAEVTLSPCRNLGSGCVCDIGFVFGLFIFMLWCWSSHPPGRESEILRVLWVPAPEYLLPIKRNYTSETPPYTTLPLSFQLHIPAITQKLLWWKIRPGEPTISMSFMWVTNTTPPEPLGDPPSQLPHFTNQDTKVWAVKRLRRVPLSEHHPPQPCPPTPDPEIQPSNASHPRDPCALRAPMCPKDFSMLGLFPALPK